ncbi:MAG: GTP 3',8-cyclase MoaA [Desulfurivibrio sp.]|nr:GTP 3',8-cyclase MoaA [Desulfurivibrio sp.]MBU4033435.1 GTP 3',8-cyclase MoaA [Pseudomonadota bacterium]MBU4119906.1 GTP 3',8-cyclase MoaA [Pseudomonadota bacterium]
MPNTLCDSHGRNINYLRLAVTDRCNLRCTYCMPKGCFAPRNELLNYDELLRVVRIFAGLGIGKIRLTGGEPFVRKGFVDFLAEIHSVTGIKEVGITTNGTLCFDQIQRLKASGVTGINFSLDTLSPTRYQKITGSDLFHEAFAAIMEAIIQGIRVKINVVVLDNDNSDELLHLARLAENYPVEVRFIEPMHFNGSGKFTPPHWNAMRLKGFFLENLSGCVEILKKIRPHGSTAQLFKVKNYSGIVGIIAGHSRSFCASCNKVRLTPQGMLKNCLYDNGVLDMKGLLRSGADDREIIIAIQNAVAAKSADGFIVEKDRRDFVPRSMATIGG